MVLLRRTRKLRALLPQSEPTDAVSDTALGDWYVNRVVVDRKPLLLLLSSRSLLPILIPARDVRTLPSRLPGLVGSRLKRLGMAGRLIDSESAAMTPVSIASTVDRSVVGVMVDFAKSIPYYVEKGQWNDTILPFVESRLAETPCHASRRFEDVIFPEKKAAELVALLLGPLLATELSRFAG